MAFIARASRYQLAPPMNFYLGRASRTCLVEDMDAVWFKEALAP